MPHPLIPLPPYTPWCSPFVVVSGYVISGAYDACSVVAQAFAYCPVTLQLMARFSTAAQKDLSIDGNSNELYLWKARSLRHATWPAPALVNFAFMCPGYESMDKLSIMQNGEVSFNGCAPHGAVQLEGRSITITFNCKGHAHAMKTKTFVHERDTNYIFYKDEDDAYSRILFPIQVFPCVDDEQMPLYRFLRHIFDRHNTATAAPKPSASIRRATSAPIRACVAMVPAGRSKIKRTAQQILATDHIVSTVIEVKLNRNKIHNQRMPAPTKPAVQQTTMETSMAESSHAKTKSKSQRRKGKHATTSSTSTPSSPVNNYFTYLTPQMPVPMPMQSMMIDPTRSFIGSYT